MNSPLRIALNCELAPGIQAGGTQSVTSGLIRALGELDGPEEYLLICHPQNREWIESLAGPNTRLVDRPTPTPSWRERVRRSLLNRLAGDERPTLLPQSDGFYESLGAQVIHWPWQHFAVTAIPAIFNPHDLLHLHYPQFFKPAEIAAREATYPLACRLAQTVVVASQWTKSDLMERYGLATSRLQVIPWAPPTVAADLAEGAAEAVRRKYQLPEAFAFFPAVTWEHKNHLRLLAALAEVRDVRGLRVNLVCTGHRFERHAVKVEAEVRRLGLETQVRFLGAVSFAELRATYRAAQFVIVPTLFEAASGPVFEAWQEDVPVACSTVTSLPQQAGKAALLFDPYDVGAIAEALFILSTRPERRAELQAAGRQRLADFSWQRTAQAYRAVYRKVAGQASPADRDLLEWDWMASPDRTS